MKMLKNTRLALLSFLFLCLALFAAETARVTNLTATHRNPGTVWWISPILWSVALQTPPWPSPSRGTTVIGTSPFP